jgi:hypothetical protein
MRNYGQGHQIADFGIFIPQSLPASSQAHSAIRNEWGLFHPGESAGIPW